MDYGKHINIINTCLSTSFKDLVDVLEVHHLSQKIAICNILVILSPGLQQRDHLISKIFRILVIHGTQFSLHAFLLHLHLLATFSFLE